MNQTSADGIQVIKKSIAYRAKYRVGDGDTPTVRSYAPALAVPHPRNRGGDAVKTLRTKQIVGDVFNVGCDTISANCNAVAVEQKPQSNTPRATFQEQFETQISADPGMARKVSNIDVVIGTLSHGHSN